MFSYEGKKTLVTGAGRGIGRAIALAARSRDQLEEVAGEVRAVGRQAHVLPTDLLDVEQARAMNGRDGRAARAGQQRGRGGGRLGRLRPLSDATPEAFDGMYVLNLRSPLFASIAAAKQMSCQGSGGAILNVVSIDAVFPAPTEALYGSAKAALVNLTRVLGYEAGKDRIRVDAIAPGVIDTALTAPWLATEEQRIDRASFYPIDRTGVPDDMAAAAVYLCSHEAEWVSGTCST